MKKAGFVTAALAAAAAGAAGLAGAAMAWADDADTGAQPSGVQALGQLGRLVDGGNVQGWTVNGLQPSADAIPYQPGGALWEATATDQAIAGGALPFIPNFSARAANGDDYRVLFQVPTAQGVNPSMLAEGQSTTGKLYFDVTGQNPDSVVYETGGHDRLVWVQPPPSDGTGGGTASYYGTSSPATGSAYAGGQSVPTGPQSGVGAAAAAAPGATTPAAPATAAKPATAAADDVHGAATAAQPKPAASPLDIHDTTAPATVPAQPATQGTATASAAPAPAAAPSAAAPAPAAPAPAAPAPAASAPAPAAAPAAPPAPVTPATVAPATKAPAAY